MSTKWKVRSYRIRALAWFPITAVLMYFFPDEIWVVLFYSAYANFTGDWSSGEAADDRELKAKIQELQDELEEMRSQGGAVDA
jgi:hypothetical protein